MDKGRIGLEFAELLQHFLNPSQFWGCWRNGPNNWIIWIIAVDTKLPEIKRYGSSLGFKIHRHTNCIEFNVIFIIKSSLCLICSIFCSDRRYAIVFAILSPWSFRMRIVISDPFPYPLSTLFLPRTHCSSSSSSGGSENLRPKEDGKGEVKDVLWLFKIYDRAGSAVCTLNRNGPGEMHSDWLPG